MNILIINGHPNPTSLNTALAQTYAKTAEASGATVRYLAIGALDFNPNLQYGYAQRMELEPDLLRALEDINWSTHQVWIHPMWWLGMPAIMKGFFDRLFLPGLTFKHHKTGETEGLLKGKTARILITMGDLSPNLHQEAYQSAGIIQLKEGILAYCGVQTDNVTTVGPLNDFEEKDMQPLFQQIVDYAEIDISKYKKNISN